MTKKQGTVQSIAGLIVGIVGGIAGTAFSMGADRQRVNDLLVLHTSQIVELKEEDTNHTNDNAKNLDRLAATLVDQINKLQLNIKELTGTVSELTGTVSDVHTDTQVIKAVMTRMENDIKALDKH